MRKTDLMEVEMEHTEERKKSFAKCINSMRTEQISQN